MTKAEIVNEIARTTGVDKTSVLAIVEKFMEVVLINKGIKKTDSSPASDIRKRNYQDCIAKL